MPKDEKHKIKIQYSDNTVQIWSIPASEKVPQVQRQVGLIIFTYAPPRLRRRNENGGFTLKTHQMFFVHTTPRNLKMQQSPAILDMCERKKWASESGLAFVSLLNG